MIITVDTIIWGCVTITTVGGAVVLVCRGIHKVLEPINKLKETVEWHSQRLKEHSDSIKDLQIKSVRDYEALGEIKEMGALQTKCSVDIMNHMIDGNHTEAMKRTRDEAIELLAKR